MRLSSPGTFKLFPFKFEFTCALAYILPKRYRLSVSIIGLLSILVIAAVVWLTLVFFSATEGFEKRWSTSISTILGDVHIHPTDAYYASASSKIDSYSEKSDFRLLYLDEKAKQLKSPYDPIGDPPTELSTAPYKNYARELEQLLTSLNKQDPSITALPFSSATVPFELHTSTTTINQLSLVLGYPVLPKNIASLMVIDKAQPQKPLLPLLKKSDILLPKSFLQLGATTGSTGKFQYTQEGLSGTTSKALHSTVTGFFDPGILPIGGKLILAPIDLVKKLQREPQVGAFFSSMGYAIWSEREQPESIKVTLQEALLKAGLSDYFQVETYKEYEFTKDLFLQLSSEKNLFRLLALIIIIVASSNITSLLLILVFTKKQEIAVLRAYGASKTQIGAIYTLAGSFIGLFGLIFGTIFALVTMHFLSSILSLLGALQGHDVLSQAFYGTSVPTSISKSALLFVTVSTITISALSGAFAAISACRVNISQALKGE